MAREKVRVRRTVEQERVMLERLPPVHALARLVAEQRVLAECAQDVEGGVLLSNQH